MIKSCKTMKHVNNNWAIKSDITSNTASQQVLDFRLQLLMSSPDLLPDSLWPMFSWSASRLVSSSFTRNLFRSAMNFCLRFLWRALLGSLADFRPGGPRGFSRPRLGSESEPSGSFSSPVENSSSSSEKPSGVVETIGYD